LDEVSPLLEIAPPAPLAESGREINEYPPDDKDALEWWDICG